MTTPAKPRKRAAKQTETQLVAAILQYLKLIGVPAWRVNAGAMRMTGKPGMRDRYIKFNGAAGCADISGILPWSGQRLEIEAKIGKNKPTLLQRQFLSMVDRAGGLAFVAYDVDTVIDQMATSKKLHGVAVEMNHPESSRVRVISSVWSDPLIVEAMKL